MVVKRWSGMLDRLLAKFTKKIKGIFVYHLRPLLNMFDFPIVIRYRHTGMGSEIRDSSWGVQFGRFRKKKLQKRTTIELREHPRQLTVGVP